MTIPIRKPHLNKNASGAYNECPGPGKRIEGRGVPCAKALVGSEEDVFLSRATSDAKIPGVVWLMVRLALVLLQPFFGQVKGIVPSLRALWSLEMFLY